MIGVFSDITLSRGQLVLFWLLQGRVILQLTLWVRDYQRANKTGDVINRNVLMAQGFMECLCVLHSHEELEFVVSGSYKVCVWWIFRDEQLHISGKPRYGVLASVREMQLEVQPPIFATFHAITRVSLLSLLEQGWPTDSATQLLSSMLS